MAAYTYPRDFISGGGRRAFPVGSTRTRFRPRYPRPRRPRRARKAAAPAVAHRGAHEALHAVVEGDKRAQLHHLRFAVVPPDVERLVEALRIQVHQVGVAQRAGFSDHGEARGLVVIAVQPAAMVSSTGRRHRPRVRRRALAIHQARRLRASCTRLLQAVVHHVGVCDISRATQHRGHTADHWPP